MTQAESNRRIAQACGLLEGKSRQLLREMTEEMEAKAEALRFKQPPHLRDQINAIAALGKKQTGHGRAVRRHRHLGTGPAGLRQGCYAILHMEGAANLAGRETELLAAPVEEDEGEMLGALALHQFAIRSACRNRGIL